MNYALVYEFNDSNEDGVPEAIISRYNNGYKPGLKPDLVVTVYANSITGLYETAEGVDDVEGDDDIDEDDASYYTLAADLASAMVTLSSMDEKRLYKCIMVSFASNSQNAALPDVNIGLYKKDSDMTDPDSVVTVTGYNKGLYREVVNATDADSDGDTDLDDHLIHRKIANSFASMRDFKA
ncbi:hypothetical protein [Pseudomonas mediterranea]|uniref:Uncharacterized protein n=1 Tax=Pseudomonas mediterranea TaxID=183795 RepID=A0AAX2D5W6_9PSED|nr:hypothetical protein [Pseudomonas mediterranea]KGU82412.1 hypothetical protein N005_27555 [Pseudomonas mediterranea CFBP 5447]UZE01143.1 hypothetical protein LOY71_00505 [Pseudomonas mediterranea]SDU10429.1 hypothetical protein SAMN05216476_0446 [Pseudomonas mediterranea]